MQFQTNPYTATGGQCPVAGGRQVNKDQHEQPWTSIDQHRPAVESLSSNRELERQYDPPPRVPPASVQGRSW